MKGEQTKRIHSRKINTSSKSAATPMGANNASQTSFKFSAYTLISSNVLSAELMLPHNKKMHTTYLHAVNGNHEVFMDRKV